MEIYLDDANPKHINEMIEWGVITGITTNPKILLAAGKLKKGETLTDRIKFLCDYVQLKHVSVELTSDDLHNQIYQAASFHEISPKVVIKIPMWGDGSGLKLLHHLKDQIPDIRINMTILMTREQSILALLGGSDYISIFWNRILDSDKDPIEIVSSLTMFRSPTQKIIVGSIRKQSDVIHAFESGADVVTVPYHILKTMPFNSKTEETIQEFDLAWGEFT